MQRSISTGRPRFKERGGITGLGLVVSEERLLGLRKGEGHIRFLLWRRERGTSDMVQKTIRLESKRKPKRLQVRRLGPTQGALKDHAQQLNGREHYLTEWERGCYHASSSLKPKRDQSTITNGHVGYAKLFRRSEVNLDP